MAAISIDVHNVEVLKAAPGVAVKCMSVTCESYLVDGGELYARDTLYLHGKEQQIRHFAELILAALPEPITEPCEEVGELEHSTEAA